MPIKGPGKFEGETYICRYAYDNVDEDLGESENFGWYGRFSGKIKNRGPFHLIVTENSVGFVSCAFYDSEAELNDAWALLEDEYTEFSESEE